MRELRDKQQDRKWSYRWPKDDFIAVVTRAMQLNNWTFGAVLQFWFKKQARISDNMVYVFVLSWQ